MTLEEEAIEILHTFGKDGCTIADSGGKDSSVLKHIALKTKEQYGLDFKIAHNHTTVDAPETVYFVQSEKKRFEEMGFKYDIVRPRLSMWDLIVEKGFPPTRLMRYCCAELKETYGARERLVTGVRKAESTNRKNNQGVVTIPKPKEEIKAKAEDENSNFHTTDKGGVVIYNYDNHDDVSLIYTCMRTNKVMVNPLINWDDEYLWWYIRQNDIKINPLYEKGRCRVGCIGCPMAGKERWEHFAQYPKYETLYIKAFDRMIEKRKSKGLKSDWKDGKACFRWWMEDENIDGQLKFNEWGELEEI